MNELKLLVEAKLIKLHICFIETPGLVINLPFCEELVLLFGKFDCARDDDELVGTFHLNL